MAHDQVGTAFSIVVGFLTVIVAFLLAISVKLSDIAARLKERFPTEEEEDYKWSQVDPMGHYEAHKKEKK